MDADSFYTRLSLKALPGLTLVNDKQGLSHEKQESHINARNAAYRRVEAAMNLLVPHLFPLITAVEEKLSSTRPMPMSMINPPQGQQTRGDRYELTGVVDVISSTRRLK